MNRLPFLQKGIVNIITKATGGLGVVLEHRYYGTSFPVPDLSIESLRFLTTDQAVADMAYFAQHVQFEGLEDQNLTAPNVPYIAYGGSYAGAFVAILRKAYPDVYWGAIASSGVTQAIYDYWEFYQSAGNYVGGDCEKNTAKLTDVMDTVLLGKTNGTDDVQKLKDLFGLGGITLDADFANLVSGGGIAYIISTNWDPAINSTGLGDYCDLISNRSVIDNNTESKREAAVELLKATGYEAEVDTLINPLLNYIGYVNITSVITCTKSQDDCYTTNNKEYYAQDDIEQKWRSWPFQYCFEWGFMLGGSGVPSDQLPILSRLVDMEFQSAVCRDAFNITEPSQVERINQWGGFNFSYPRLAFIDGEHDPWRQATPHAVGAPERESTTDEPFWLIPTAVHHWDENGLFDNETTATLPPQKIKDVQAEEVRFVKAWLEEWKTVKSRAN